MPVVGTVVILGRTVFGREVRAVGGDERIAFLTGINIDRTKILLFVLLGLLCGMAGLLQDARDMAATAQLGEGLELDVIAAVLVGSVFVTIDRKKIGIIK